MAQFPLPVVTGIGHDKDTSVADMVAHTALKTPTAVAGWLVERMAETDGWLDCAALQLNDMTKAAMHASEVRLERLSGEVRRLSGELLTRQTLRLEHFTELLPDAARDFLARQGVRLGNAAELIAGRSPERILRLGFAVLRAGGRAVTSAGSVAEGEQVEIEVSDGKIDATVNSGKIWQKRSDLRRGDGRNRKDTGTPAQRRDGRGQPRRRGEARHGADRLVQGAAAQGRSRREQDFRVIPLHA